MSTVVFIPKVVFQKPTIGPRDYISVGASGWPELFSRKDADIHLARFLGAVEVHEALDNFSEYVETKCEGKCGWMSVIGYLSRVTKTDKDHIPYAVAIAFWGQTLMRKKDVKPCSNHL